MALGKYGWLPFPKGFFGLPTGEQINRIVTPPFGGVKYQPSSPPIGYMNPSGAIYDNAGATIGQPIFKNAANTNDQVADGFVLPAVALVQGITLELNFWGLLGATGNNKRIRLWVDPTLVGATINPATGAISGGSVSGAGAGALLYDSGTQTGNNVPWMLSSYLSKIGPNGANSQNFITQPIFSTTHGGVVLPAGGPAIALNESVSHNFVLTVASQTSGIFDDVELWDTQIVGWN